MHGRWAYADHITVGEARVVVKLTWLLGSVDTGISPDGSEDWDDAVVVYKQQMIVSKSGFEATVVAVELFVP